MPITAWKIPWLEILFICLKSSPRSFLRNKIGLAVKDDLYQKYPVSL